MDVAVIGAGVVGLAVAARLAERTSVAIIERHPAIALETSSHNSQVVHGGMYYPTGSLKHLLCIEGRRLLYDWCEARGVPVRRTGKLIVATHASELGGLEGVWEQAQRNGVEGMSRLTEAEARALEPAVPAVGALLSVETGAVDAYAFARSMEAAARERGALVALAHEVQSVRRDSDGFTLELRDPEGNPAELRAATIVNSAGHGAPAIASALGYPLEGAEGIPALRQRPNRGRYYDVSASVGRAVSRHIYPVPHGTGDMRSFMRTAGGLGVHLTVDIDGGVHLGPDTEWLEADAVLDYRSDDTRRAAFLEAGRRLLPGLTDADIAPGQVGYRPKLDAAGSDADFVIWAERGYVHLGGIESPGLTASLAIARRVSELI